MTNDVYTIHIPDNHRFRMFTYGTPVPVTNVQQLVFSN